ncbi:MAG TPA: adenylate/guanylate cyclase domain-containing protein, partial [Myxococcaceae bacterium]|nr:adenylate/guanylate cyclase domain-containing protein [Myxococcaceae bacterium]
LGEGPLDLVFVPGWVTNLEVSWEEPRVERFYRRLASFSRLILFDKRGTGLSDPVPEAALPTLEQRMDDVRAVMDAVGSERAAVFGFSEGGNMSLLFAASHPERTVALVTYGIFAKRVWSEDYPWAPTPVEREAWYALIENDWGRTADLGTLAPSLADDPGFRAWFGRLMRQSVSPRAALALARMNTQVDVRQVLPAIRVPTLVMHRVGDLDAKVEEARYIAARIPGARLVELPGRDHLVYAGDADAVLDEVEEFLTGVRRGPEVDRVLATVLFTDIVGSTERAAALSDRPWSDLLERHHALVRKELARFRGKEVGTAGDGFLATFDGPARAVRCAAAIRAAVRGLGLEVRAGIHTGEVEVAGDDVRGLAVHVGARVCGLASPGEILVSRTVRDLVSGSGLAFEPRGAQGLKGVPGTWEVYGVAGV